MTEKVLSSVAVDSAFVINLLNQHIRKTKKPHIFCIGELFYLLFIGAVSDTVRGN